MMLYQRQSGFTLVELMVAMAIGTLITLGAGQLFLTTFQTFKKVDELSRKQETVVFASTVLVNEYRKGVTDYSLAETTGSPEECSVRDPNDAPVIGGLALYEGECNTDRLVSPAEGDNGQVLDGYHHFNIDFKRESGKFETLSFYVMQRDLAQEDFKGDQQYQVGTGDAIIAGGALSGVNGDILQGDSRTSNNLGSHAIPDPRSNPAHSNYAGYIESFKNLSDVVSTCESSVISNSSASKFYCNSNINNLNVEGLSGKVVVAENGVSLGQSGNSSVKDVAIVAGGAVNVNGSNSAGAEFEGVIWSAGSSNLSASGVNFQGSVVAGGAVTVNNASSITADWNAWDLLSLPGYEFSMAQQFNHLGTQINVAEENQ